MNLNSAVDSAGFVGHFLSDMSMTTVSTRQFTKEFATWRSRSVQVTDRGHIVGQWTPASKQAERVDFLARATADTLGKLEFTGAQLLREGKKR